MSEFEFLRHVTIGQYLPTGSAVHRLDPRAKMLMAALLVLGAVLSSSAIALSAALAVVLIGLVAARIPLRYAVQGLRPALPFLIFLALLQVFTIPANDIGTVLWQWWRITITLTDLRAALAMLLRFAVLILGLSLFSFTTSLTELTHGSEHLLRPFQRVGLPAHELALVAAIAIRYVPLLALEAERIAKAQASRGADFGRGGGNAFRRAVRMLPLLVPLFVAALRRGETLVLAMEARNYSGGKGRTHLIHLQARCADVVAIGLVALLAAGLIAAGRANLDARLWHWVVRMGQALT
ncbi:MAG TPA: energy-coupling factor transporter transmembrane component T [Anaerolineae bacterium]|nr:energy-coupling factor transporter transmembrane component T [Anaerolineae bacterium]